MNLPVHGRATARPAGAWPLAPGQPTTLCPPRCGHLRARAGRLYANGAPLVTAEPVRVWAGERVQLRNASHAERGFFSWDYCVRQPGAASTARMLLARLRARLVAAVAQPRPTTPPG